MASKINLPTVVIGDGTVTVMRKGSSEYCAVANILGTDRDENGNIHTMWLDRVVHFRNEVEFQGYAVSGAISTVLTANCAI